MQMYSALWQNRVRVDLEVEGGGVRGRISIYQMEKVMSDWFRDTDGSFYQKIYPYTWYNFEWVYG